jgi:hypothetical protein
MGLVSIGPFAVPLPEGWDTWEGLSPVADGWKVNAANADSVA